MPDPPVPWKGGYPTGTFMGLANLVLARNALAEELADDADLAARVGLAEGRARAALRRHALWVLGAPPGRDGLVASGSWPTYTLYALEKVCVFLDREEVGGLAWYRRGAERLLATQRTDGAWAMHGAEGENVATAFALLFLLRDAEAYRPVTPRPVGRPTGPSTPGEAPAREPSSADAARGLPLAVADAGLARFEKTVGARRLPGAAPALEALAFVRRAYAGYRAVAPPLPEAEEAWCRRAEDALLEAAVLFDGSARADRDARMVVALAALEVLGDTHARIGPRLMRRVLDRENDATFPEAFRPAWYGAALDALRRVDPPQLAGWLAGRCVDDDPDHLWRTSAALVALGGHAETQSPSARLAAARTVLAGLSPLARRSEGDFRWRGLRRDAAVCLYRLLGEDAAGDFPPLPGREPKAELAAVTAWVEARLAAMR